MEEQRPIWGGVVPGIIAAALGRGSNGSTIMGLAVSSSTVLFVVVDFLAGCIVIAVVISGLLSVMAASSKRGRSLLAVPVLVVAPPCPLESGVFWVGAASSLKQFDGSNQAAMVPKVWNGLPVDD